jgi:hypothetical protein
MEPNITLDIGPKISPTNYPILPEKPMKRN